MILVILLMIVSGVSFGVIANLASPDPIIIGALVIMTFIYSISFTLKFRLLYSKEILNKMID